MRCDRCHEDNAPDRPFCIHCGAPLGLRCAKCRHSLPPSARFCPECGARVAASAPAQFKPSEAHIPPHLAERILTSARVFEGERKQVTVLFADLKGSMELLANRDPEDAQSILDPVLERLMEAVHHYEGTVNQVMGDGIMALFGAPLAHEDHAVRACYAALRMQESVKRFAAELQRTVGVPVQIRVGLNSGDVVLRSVRSDLHVDYSAVGQTTHVAARLEQIALPGSILISSDTLLLAEGYVQVKLIGPVAMKGLPGPLDVYELVGAGPIRRRLQALVSRGLTRFVGRDAEQVALRAALEKARGGSGQIVAVVGEPGVGKSRLLWEFAHSPRTRDCLLLESGSVSYGRATPYLPLIDLLKPYFGIEDSDSESLIREKVSRKLLAVDEALVPMLPAFLSLLDVSVEDPEWPQLDPAERREWTLEACRRLLLRESQVHPLVLVFEDLHWIDSETLAFLDRLVESLPAARVLLLVNYRPEFTHGWGTKGRYTEIRVQPLPPESADALLLALLGSDRSLVPLKRLLLQQTEGNPFFLEETVRTLIETSVLTGEPGAYRLAERVAAIHVPPTVQAVLAARIDRLPAEEKHLLQSAAVIGHDVPHNTLEAIADVSPSDLRRYLSDLQASEFLYEVQLPHGSEYMFRHALTHEVAYGTILNERRRALHVRVLDAIERLYADRLVEQVERLAHHAVRGELWGQALVYLRRAAAKAFSRSAHREAVGYLEQALVALERLPDSRERREHAVDVRFDLRNSLLPLGDHARYVKYLHEAEMIAAGLNDQHRSAWVAAYMTAYLYLVGDEDGALRSGQRALELADTLGDFSLQVSTNTWLGQVLYHRGEYRRAAGHFRTNVTGLTEGNVRERFGLPQLPSVHSRTCLVWCLSELGEFTEAVAHGEEAVRIAESVEHPLSLAVACAGLGMADLRRGELEHAIRLLERGLAVTETWQVPLWFPRLASALGYAYALSGRVLEGLPLLERAVEKAASMGLMGGHSLLVSYLAEGYLLAGESEEATRLAHRALELATQHRERGYEAWTLRLVAETALRSSPADVDTAAEYAARALGLAEALAMRPLVAQTRVVLGLALAMRGRTADATTALDQAARVFRDLGMGFWLARTHAEITRLA